MNVLHEGIPRIGHHAGLTVPIVLSTGIGMNVVHEGMPRIDRHVDQTLPSVLIAGPGMSVLHVGMPRIGPRADLIVRSVCLERRDRDERRPQPGRSRQSDRYDRRKDDTRPPRADRQERPDRSDTERTEHRGRKEPPQGTRSGGSGKSRAVRHRGATPGGFKQKQDQAPGEITWPMRLNKYIAASGVCSRRAAADLVKAGKVEHNGQQVLEPGILVEEKDEVKVHGKVVKPEVNFYYLLLNKAKNTLCTVEDDRGRATVLDQIPEAQEVRLYPVGRLDRNTTGLLVITNDGMLAQRLSHPRNEVKKIYQATLERPMHEADLHKLANGIELTDGPAEVDAIGWPDPEDRKTVVVELHSGRNRIVRRLFSALGYEVVRLDRIGYAGLTKRDLPRGRYRHLTDREVIMLRHFIGRKKNLGPNE